VCARPVGSPARRKDASRLLAMPLGYPRPGRAAVETNAAVSKSPLPVAADVAIAIATPVIGAALGDDEEVGGTGRLCRTGDRQAEVRDVVPDPRSRRGAGQGTLRSTKKAADRLMPA